MIYDPTKPPPRERPMLGWHGPVNDDTMPSHQREWLSHVEAGRIGGNPPSDPALRARVLRNERVLLGLGSD